MSVSHKVNILNEPLARYAAECLYLKRPYPYIRRSAMDAFRLFQDYQLQCKVVESIVKMVLARGKGYQTLTALSSWGYLLALAVAEKIEQSLNSPCNVICLGGELFPEPLTIDMFREPHETLLIDDIIHTGGTLKDAVQGELLERYKLTASLCTVVIDYDEMAQELRKPLLDILESGICEIFAVTKASYIRKLSNPLRRILALTWEKQRVRIKPMVVLEEP